MHSVGILILIGVLGGVLFAPPRWAALCMLAAVFYLTQGQSFSVAGVNMFAFRFVELAGFLRVLSKKEWAWSRLGSIDKALLFLFLFLPIPYLSHSPEEYAFAIGQSVDAITCYFAFRGLIAGEEDVVWLLKAMVGILAVYSVLIVIQSITLRNPFEFLGGQVASAKVMREGRLRCAGSFRHPSIMGSMAASFVSLYIGMAFRAENRRIAIVGIVACLAMVFASNSGGPFNCLATGAVGWGMWRIQKSMRVVRRTMVVGVVLVALFMKAPIWYLPSKVAGLSGGDGWHRSRLMEMAFKNMDVWCLRGCHITETRDWIPYVLGATGGADITNQYLKYGIQGGCVAMSGLIVMLVVVFKMIGKRLSAIRELDATRYGRSSKALMWGFGVVVAVHAVNWIGISYFDQSYALWYFQLACVAALGRVLTVSDYGRTASSVLPAG